MAETMDEQQAAYIEAGQRLRELRQGKNLSQETISMAANIDQSTFSKAERPGLNELSLKKLQVVAQAMDCVIEISFRPRKPTSSPAIGASSWRR